MMPPKLAEALLPLPTVSVLVVAAETQILLVLSHVKTGVLVTKPPIVESAPPVELRPSMVWLKPPRSRVPGASKVAAVALPLAAPVLVPMMVSSVPVGRALVTPILMVPALMVVAPL